MIAFTNLFRPLPNLHDSFMTDHENRMDSLDFIRLVPHNPQSLFLLIVHIPQSSTPPPKRRRPRPILVFPHSFTTTTAAAVVVVDRR